jgi:integrase/recombinase XerD
MSYIFNSIFANEINDYLKLVVESGRYVGKIKSSLKSLDSYLTSRSSADKILTESMARSWLDGKNVKPRTKAGILNDVRGFAKYLTSVGHQVCLPDIPLLHQDYIPYIFSSEELASIFHAADNHQAKSHCLPTDIQFPVLLRVLYGCGLRLREALTITWKEIDLNSGVILIHKAKNQKERVVPISDSLKSILVLYQRLVLSNGSCREYVFESHRNPGNPYYNSTFWDWFSKILCKAGISYTRNSIHERGPCPHCLRHLFVIHSFMKSEAEGRDLGNTVPFLSAYLGHEGLLETQKYLRASYILYTQSHQRVNEYIGGIFPEVSFE